MSNVIWTKREGHNPFPLYHLTMSSAEFYVDFSIDKEHGGISVWNIYSFKPELKIFPPDNYSTELVHSTLDKAKKYVVNSILCGQL